MALSVAADVAGVACTQSIDSFLAAVDTFSEHDLLGSSRCHGWTRLDVVVHVLAGWQEMLGGLVSPVDTPPTVDAASYWPAFREQYADDDPLLALMTQRRRTATYARPAAATAQLHDVGESLRRGVESFAHPRCLWDGHVFTAGDYLAVWAVENVVHQLDLISNAPASASGLSLSRRTIEALVGQPLPDSWSDETATLIGTGRQPAPDGLGAWSSLLPALG
ncbi:MAG TPA: maleylpyruvate isomerase N-terminal domain-containing protein [Marmoricola sp.]|nr:maleylpyruvate isomerase N-terminal domain-containing protein [Marmoricola sp.]